MPTNFRTDVYRDPEVIYIFLDVYTTKVLPKSWITSLKMIKFAYNYDE